MIAILLRRSCLAGALALPVLAAPPLLDHPELVVLRSGALADDAIRVPKSVCYWITADWADMNVAERGAWSTLGWDEKSWESDDPDVYPDSEAKTWSDLTDRERTAAQSLGYTEDTWDNIQDLCGDA